MVKNPPAKAGDLRDAGLIPDLGKSPQGGHGNPLQYFCLENSMDRGQEGYSPQSPTESDMTEATQHSHMHTEDKDYEENSVLCKEQQYQVLQKHS